MGAHFTGSAWLSVKSEITFFGDTWYLQWTQLSNNPKLSENMLHSISRAKKKKWHHFICLQRRTTGRSFQAFFFSFFLLRCVLLILSFMFLISLFIFFTMKEFFSFDLFLSVVTLQTLFRLHLKSPWSAFLMFHEHRRKKNQVKKMKKRKIHKELAGFY